jgi:VWFA-related protein
MAVIALCVAVVSSAAGAAQQPVFRRGVDAVVVDVAVFANGQPVRDLTAGEFEVRDNGVVQQLIDMNATRPADGTSSRRPPEATLQSVSEALPIDLALIVDVSGSVQGPLLEALSRAISGVHQRIRSGDRVRLVTFNDRIIEHSAGAEDTGRALKEALRRTSGNTALLDAIAMSLISVAEPGRRQMAIVFTDGRDNLSILNESAVLDVAKRSGVTISIVAVVDNPMGFTLFGPPTPLVPHRTLFQTLTELTGGQFLALRRNDELSAPFLQAFDAFRTSYVLRYNLQNVPRPGWHTIDVKVTRPGTYEVRARKGYFGG